MGIKSALRLVICLILVNALVFIPTFPLIAIYGPFPNLQRTVVGSIMTSRHRQYITWLLSDRQISAILADRSLDTPVREALISFQNRHDQGINLSRVDGSRFHGMLLEVKDPSRVKVATAGDMQVEGETVSSMAINNQAIAAVNAGGFDDPSGTGTGRLPYGVIIQRGRFLVGENIKSPVQLVGLTGSGVLVAGNYTVPEMKGTKIAEGISFGPPLILNGKKLITRGDGGWGIGPRTAIGQRRDGTILSPPLGKYRLLGTDESGKIYLARLNKEGLGEEIFTGRLNEGFRLAERLATPAEVSLIRPPGLSG